MRHVKQFGIILMFSFVGEVLNALIPLPIPAGIYGIVLLFAALVLKIVKLDDVEKAGDFLNEILTLTLIPSAVGLMAKWDVLRPSWVQYLVVLVVTTIIVMAVTGLVSQRILQKTRRKEEGL